MDHDRHGETQSSEDVNKIVDDYLESKNEDHSDSGWFLILIVINLIIIYICY